MIGAKVNVTPQKLRNTTKRALTPAILFESFVAKNNGNEEPYVKLAMARKPESSFNVPLVSAPLVKTVIDEALASPHVDSTTIIRK